MERLALFDVDFTITKKETLMQLYIYTWKEDKKNISMDKWKEIIAFANKVGAITCTNYGAIASMPTLSEVNAIQ